MPQGCGPVIPVPGAPGVPVPESRAMDTGRAARDALRPTLTRSTFFQASPSVLGKVTSIARGSTSEGGAHGA